MDIVAKRRVATSVWAARFVHTGLGRCEITGMWRCEEGEPDPEPGSLTFAQVERPRPGGGQVVVALIVGPQLAGLQEPDWAQSALLAVDNPMPALAYGGTSAWDYGKRQKTVVLPSGEAGELKPAARRSREGISPEEAARRDKACEASRKSRLRRELRGQGKSEDEIRRLVP